MCDDVECICIVQETRDGAFIDTTPLTNLPISHRIRLTEYIPSLLNQALECECDVRRDALDAAAKLEQSLADLAICLQCTAAGIG